MYLLKNLFSLKNNLEEIHLIEEEVKLYDSIDKNIIKNFKKIVLKINARKIHFKTVTKDQNDNFLVSFLDNKMKYFFPLDYQNIFSSYNFFLEYLKFKDYEFDYRIFQKIHLSRNRVTKLSGINKLLYFLPFRFHKPNKKNKNFYRKYFPRFYLKDKSFLGKKSAHWSYCNNYEKSTRIKKGIKDVINNLNDNFSKENYKILMNKNAQTNWKNFFNKSSTNSNFQYSDFVKLDENSTIINCGVGGGMELNVYNNVKEIYNIDPGVDTYLDEPIKYVLKNSKTKNYFIKCALYRNENIYTEKEKNKIFDIKTLKEIIDDHDIQNISLIKSDIEGAERLMVNDLIEICKKFNAQLAISIYHNNFSNSPDETLSDYVDIPLKLISNLRDKYNFYFNHYSFERWEAIFYCKPKNLG